MSTLSEIRDNVFLRIAESTGATFTDAEVTRFVNREYEHLQTIINEENDEYLAKIALVSTTTDELYDFPSDFVKLLMMEFYASTSDNVWTEVPKISIHQRETYKNSSGYWGWREPNIYYFVVGGQYGLIPVRLTAGNNDLRLTYIYKPPVLALDDDEPVIPVLYHELLEIGTVNRLRSTLKEPPIDLEEYVSKVQNMTESSSPRVRHKPNQVRFVRGIY